MDHKLTATRQHNQNKRLTNLRTDVLTVVNGRRGDEQAINFDHQKNIFFGCPPRTHSLRLPFQQRRFIHSFLLIIGLVSFTFVEAASTLSRREPIDGPKIKSCGCLFVCVLTKHKPIDSSWKALHFCFWARDNPTNSLTASWRKLMPGVGRLGSVPRPFTGICRPTLRRIKLDPKEVK